MHRDGGVDNSGKPLHYPQSLALMLKGNAERCARIVFGYDLLVAAAAWRMGVLDGRQLALVRFESNNKIGHPSRSRRDKRGTFFVRRLSQQYLVVLINLFAHCSAGRDRCLGVSHAWAIIATAE